MTNTNIGAVEAMSEQMQDLFSPDKWVVIPDTYRVKRVRYANNCITVTVRPYHGNIKRFRNIFKKIK